MEFLKTRGFTGYGGCGATVVVSITDYVGYSYFSSEICLDPKLTLSK